jgi:hypothetical protein
MRSEPLGPQQGVGQVEQETEGDEAGEGIVEDHGPSPLKPFARVGVADGCREETEAKGQHDDVQHEMLPVALCFRARKDGVRWIRRVARAISALPISDREVPLHAYIFEADAQTIL